MQTDKLSVPKRKGPLRRLGLLVKRHKFITFLILAALIGGYYYFRPSSTQAETRYVLTAVTKGSVINMVEGSGSVEAAQQVDIKPEVTADIEAVNIKAGQDIKAGDVIATLDSDDLEKAVRSARNSLSSAQASLASKLAGSTAEEIKVSENSVKTAKMSYEQAQEDLAETEYDNAVNLEKAAQDLADAQRDYDNEVASSGLDSDSQSQSLDSTYTSAQADVNSAYLSFKSALVAADDILGLGEYGENSGSNNNYLIGAKDPQSLNDARTGFYANQADFEDFEGRYRAAGQPWSKEQVEAFLGEAYELAVTMKAMADNLYNVAIGSVSASSLSETEINSMKSTASSQQSSMSSLINNLQSAKQNIAKAKLDNSSSDLSSSNSLAKAESSLATAKKDYEQAKRDAENSLEDAQDNVESKLIAYENAQAQHAEKIAPPREVDLTSLRLQVSSAKEDYEESLADLESANILAPIDGKVAKVYQVAGDSASPSTVLAAIITDQSLAVVSLNEVDVAKVEIGQKAILTFSSVDDLSISGEVVEIDSLGDSSQGVVSYEAKISFDTQDDRIKPQMSVDAQIVVDQSVDVLVVPNSALQTDMEGNYYVEILETDGIDNATSTQGVASDNLPVVTYVTVGLADDTQTEVFGGLDEGVLVVSRTISASASSSSSSSGSSNSSVSGPGMLGGGGGSNMMIINKGGGMIGG